MSRCFPFPPPGYEKKTSDHIDLLAEVLKLYAFINMFVLIYLYFVGLSSFGCAQSVFALAESYSLLLQITCCMYPVWQKLLVQ